KIALVSGASKGLGRTISKTLAKANAHVVLTSRSKDELVNVQKEIESEGGEASDITSDMKDLSSISNLFGEIEKKFGQLNILVNNAGTTVAKNALDINVDDWDHVMDTNVKGVFFASQS